MSFDHRAVDGAYVGSFLARVKEIVETRDWLTEL
jgi:2-oxoglutarate dehydrogenase E2 component (dihydrolipoamide succinyltransferase)